MPDYQSQFDLQVGDLLFQDLDCGAYCEAIEKVTYGIGGAEFSHIGLISRKEGKKVYVLEAIQQGVVETPIDSFLIRSFDQYGQPKVVVGRLRDTFSRLAPIAVQYAKTKIGTAYDPQFDLMNDRYYCSELLYYAFKEANNGAAVFKLRPMTYLDPDTGTTFPQWIEYFNDLNIPIPEGAPGLNPAGMSRSFYITMVHSYGNPTKWRGVRGL